MTVLLELRDARIDRDGVPLVEGLTLTASGGTLALVGDFAALFALLGGSAHLSAGSATLAGQPAEGAAVAGRVGLAYAELLLPDAWDLERWLGEGARLTGASRRAAAEAARASLAQLELAHLASRRIGTLTPAEKRAAGLALALLDAPPVLAIEDPCGGLDDRGLELICRSIEGARAGRDLIFSARALAPTGPEHTLLASADELVVREAGAIVAQGPLEAIAARGGRYLVAVTRHGSELRAALTDGGFSVALAGDGARLVVSLGEAQSSDAIVEAALTVEAPIVELIPLGRGAG